MKNEIDIIRPDDFPKPPVKSTSTGKKWIGIAVGVLVIGLLIGGMYYLKSLEDMPEDPEVKTNLGIQHANERDIIYTCQVADIDYLNIHNQYGDYQVKRNEENKIYIVGREGAPLLPYSSVGLYESVKSINCTLAIEGGTEHPEYYGLDDPQATVTVHFISGKETVFYIGDAEPTDTGYYICMSGSNDVYLVNSFYGERYLGDFISYYDKSISEEFSVMDFESVEIEYPDGNRTFVRTTTDEEAKQIQYVSGYMMEAPYQFGADSEIINTICESLNRLEATKVVSDSLDDEIHTRYGFDDATKVTVKINLDTTKIVLDSGVENPYYQATPDGSPYPVELVYYLGGSSERDRFIMVGDAPVIYAVDLDVFSFVDAPIYQYCQKMVSIEYLNKLDALEVEFDGEDYYFTIQDPDAGEDMVVMCGDIQLDADLFRSFYKTIISVTHNGTGERPDTDPILKITYCRIEGEDIVLEFYPYPDSERKVFISVDGGGQFVCYITKVNKVKNDLVKLFNGEEIMD